MILGEIDSGLYNASLTLHILAAIVGFGSSFVWPAMASIARKQEPPVGYIMSSAALKLGKPLTTYAIWASGVFGVTTILIGSTQMFKETWISIALGVYIIAVLFAFFVHSPNLKAMNELQRQLVEGEATPGADGPPAQVLELQARGKRAGMYGGILHLLFLILLIDMVFKPGLGG